VLGTGESGGDRSRIPCSVAEEMVVSRGTIPDVNNTYPSTQKFDADVDFLYHVKEVALVDKLLARMVEHPRCLIQLLEVFQVRSDIVCKLNELVLRETLLASQMTR
jgi:hypothetical protein